MKVRPFFIYLHMNLSKYDAIIFDLGGVLIQLNYQKTVDAFTSIGVKDFDVMYSQASQTSLFDNYETGKISTQQFINTLKNYLPPHVTPNQIVAAWNAMILEFIPENLAFLENLAETHQLFLLSNTNDIHFQKVERMLAKVSQKKLSQYFNKIYLSQNLGLRKPHAEVFHFVCSDTQIIPAKTLFIDDTLQHIEGANAMGLNTLLFPQNALLTSFIKP